MKSLHYFCHTVALALDTGICTLRLLFLVGELFGWNVVPLQGFAQSLARRWVFLIGALLLQLVTLRLVRVLIKKERVYGLH